MITKFNICRKFLLACAFVLLANCMQAQSRYQWKTGSSDGYSYRYVSNDPTQSRFYTLKNGLRLFSVKIPSNHVFRPISQQKLGVRPIPKSIPDWHIILSTCFSKVRTGLAARIGIKKNPC